MNVKNLMNKRISDTRKRLDVKDVIKNFDPTFYSEPSENYYGTGWVMTFINKNKPEIRIYAHTCEPYEYDVVFETPEAEYLNYDDMKKLHRSKSVQQKCQQLFDEWIRNN